MRVSGQIGLRLGCFVGQIGASELPGLMPRHILPCGCDTFTSALSDGALPDLYDFSLYQNPASAQGKEKAVAIPLARKLARPASPAESHI